jgi:hypothetical protein
LALGVVALATSVADAAVLAKFKDWYHWPTNDPIPVEENPNVDGVAVLRYKESTGTITVSMAIHNLLPNTNYAMWLESADYGFLWGAAADQFRTDADGSGHFIGEALSGAAPIDLVVRVPEGGTENWPDPENYIRASTVPIIE